MTSAKHTMFSPAKVSFVTVQNSVIDLRHHFPCNKFLRGRVSNKRWSADHGLLAMETSALLVDTLAQIWDNVRGYVKKKKRKVDAEYHQFQDNWTEDYYFILNKGLHVCLLCNEFVSVNKEYNLKRHFTSRHADHQQIDGQL
jgi:hypothetical protein